MIAMATQKPLYNWNPDDAERPVPDLAESEPEISDDGKTVTVKIKEGVKFSRPANREVTRSSGRSSTPWRTATRARTSAM
jgi:peptide/nickel transport system substrate-binding protein